MKALGKFFYVIFVFIMCFGFVGCGETNGNDSSEEVEMDLKVGDYVFSVELEDNSTVDELTKILPLEIKMSELNGNEKYFYLTKNLPSSEEKVKNITSGDVMLYGKNCLVIFYKSFVTEYSYTKIGRIKNIENLQKALGTKGVLVSWEIK